MLYSGHLTWTLKLPAHRNESNLSRTLSSSRDHKYADRLLDLAELLFTVLEARMNGPLAAAVAIRGGRALRRCSIEEKVPSVRSALSIRFTAAQARARRLAQGLGARIMLDARPLRLAAILVAEVRHRDGRSDNRADGGFPQRGCKMPAERAKARSFVKAASEPHFATNQKGVHRPTGKLVIWGCAPGVASAQNPPTPSPTRRRRRFSTSAIADAPPAPRKRRKSEPGWRCISASSI